MIESKKHIGKQLVLGILGGGQLAKMTLQAGLRMGLDVAIIENGANSPAGKMTKFDFGGGYKNQEELDKFIELVDVVTLENEFIDTHILEHIEKHITLAPSSKVMALVQDKFTQKETFSNVGIKTANFAKVDSIVDADNFALEYGFPFLIKTRRNGYDGYGNFTVRNSDDIIAAFDKFKKDNPERELMAESFVNFSKELAVMVARNFSGETIVYPCVETIQENHICRKVIAPANIDASILATAKEIASKCIQTIDGVGVFGVEMFLTADGEILFNEIAPRPHNSGHYTIEGCKTSQFENQIRAVLDLPLGNVNMVRPSAVMINILGEKDGKGVFENIENTLKENVSLHLYGKAESRKGRKMGHLTAIGNEVTETEERAERAFAKIVW